MTTATRDLMHQLRNLLGVVQTQTEVARTSGTLAAHRAALEYIERAANKTLALLTKTEVAAGGSDGPLVS